MAENGKGILFKNDKKTKAGQPDFTGNFILTKDLLKAWIEEIKKPDTPAEGLKVQLAAWTKQGGRGQFLSVSVSAPYDKPKPKASDDPFNDAPF